MSRRRRDRISKSRRIGKANEWTNIMAVTPKTKTSLSDRSAPAPAPARTSGRPSYSKQADLNGGREMAPPGYGALSMLSREVFDRFMKRPRLGGHERGRDDLSD